MGALDLVRLAAVLTGVPEPEAAARNALSVVEMDADDPRPVTSYSKGMKQRVKVAQALVNDPACWCSTSRSPASTPASAAT
jgi:ABC-2 type transport system ATP-binding protein